MRLSIALFVLSVVWILQAKVSSAELAIISSLETPDFGQGSAIDALEEIAFVAGLGVTAINVSKSHSLKLIGGVHSITLQNCEDIYAYVSTWGYRRLAVACADSLVIVGAESPANLEIVGYITNPDLLGGAMSVVVKDKLAFVASSRLDRVVSISLLDEAKPEVLSFLQLSSATSVALLDDNKLLVGSGGRASRVTVVSYSPSGVFMKLGSVKDSRLSGPTSRVHDFPPVSELSIGLSSADGGTFAMLNTSARNRPNVKYALHSKGRHAANDIDKATASWNPNGHKELGDAKSLCIAGNGLAYVAASHVGVVCGIYISSEGSPPSIVSALSDRRLQGIVDICASEGDAKSRMLLRKIDRVKMQVHLSALKSAKLYALNPRLGSLVALVDSPETALVDEVVTPDSNWEF